MDFNSDISLTVCAAFILLVHLSPSPLFLCWAFLDVAEAIIVNYHGHLCLKGVLDFCWSTLCDAAGLFF